MSYQEADTLIMDEPTLSPKSEFVAHHKTKIGFGRCKGLNHSVLQTPEMKGYCKWILNQGKTFYFKSTQDYVKKYCI